MKSYIVTYTVFVDAEDKESAEDKAEHIMEQTYIKPVVNEYNIKIVDK